MPLSGVCTSIFSEESTGRFPSVVVGGVPVINNGFCCKSSSLGRLNLINGKFIFPTRFCLDITVVLVSAPSEPASPSLTVSADTCVGKPDEPMVETFNLSGQSAPGDSSLNSCDWCDLSIKDG